MICLIKSTSIPVVFILLGAMSGCGFSGNRRVKIPVIPEAKYVGTKTCIEEKCHETRYDDIKISAHRKLFDDDRIDKPACELCHGPGSLHLESTGDPDLILIYRELKPKEAAEVCLTCHAQGSLYNWYNSRHYQNGVTCNTCHISHGSSDKIILRKPDPQICAECHDKVILSFAEKSNHPLQGVTATTEGDSSKQVKCLSCHKSHEKNDTQAKSLVRLTVCIECHRKYEGPFTYRHDKEPEGCLACHTKHGSPYKFLCRNEANKMCMNCHADTIHRQFTFSPLYKARKENKDNCMHCHTQIHGSENKGLVDVQTMGRPRFRFRPSQPPTQTQ